MRRFILNRNLLPPLPAPTQITIGYGDGITVTCKEYVPGLWSCRLLIGGDIEVPITKDKADAILQRCTLHVKKNRVKLHLCGKVWEIERYFTQGITKLDGYGNLTILCQSDSIAIGKSDVDGVPGSTLPEWVGEEIYISSSDYYIARNWLR